MGNICFVVRFFSTPGLVFKTTEVCLYTHGLLLWMQMCPCAWLPVHTKCWYSEVQSPRQPPTIESRCDAKGLYIKPRRFLVWITVGMEAMPGPGPQGSVEFYCGIPTRCAGSCGSRCLVFWGCRLSGTKTIVTIELAGWA